MTDATQSQTTTDTTKAVTQTGDTTATQTTGAANGGATQTQAGAASTGTVLDGGDDTTTTTTTQTPTWRDDWRVAMAKGNEGLAKKLERYTSPEAVAEALDNAQKKISAGQQKVPFPKDGTDAQKAEWREQNGVPPEAAKYDLTLSNGLVLGEADKPMVENFTTFAHGRHWSNAQVKDGLEWYAGLQAAQLEKRTEADATNRKDAEDALRAEWGGEYRVNQRVLKEHLESAGEGIIDTMLEARDAKGRLLLANPAIARWLVAEARDKNPIASVLPAGGGSGGVKGAEEEMSRLRAMMGDQTSEYWKGPNAARNQERFRELADAIERQKARAA